MNRCNFINKNYIFDTNVDTILNDKEKLDCDGEVTVTECSEASMELNTYPGLDGLTVEFYRAFWGKIKKKEILTYIYNKSNNGALMSYSQWSSILSLQFKRGIIYVLITIVRFLF